MKETWTPRQDSVKHEQDLWPAQKNTPPHWKSVEIAPRYSEDPVDVSSLLDAGHPDKILMDASIRLEAIELDPFRRTE